MTPIRAAGSLLGVLTGILAIVVAYSNAAGNQPAEWVAVAGGGLVAVSLVSWGGFRVTFYIGAVLSVMVFAADLAVRGSFPADEWELTAALSLVTVAVDLVGSRPARALSEKDSPLNLPVFG